MRAYKIIDHEYDVVPGVLEADAINLLQEFYSRGNPNAPKPHRKVVDTVK